MRQVLLYSAAFSLLLSAVASAQAWREYENRQEGFSINFPAEPKVETVPYTTASGAAVPSKRYSAEVGTGRYVLTFVELAGRPRDEDLSISHAAGVLRAKGRQIRYDAPDNLDGIPGHQLSVTQPDGRHMLASVYLYNHRLYITESSVAPGSAPAQQFQQSVAMIHPDGRVVDLEEEAEEAAAKAKAAR